MGGVGRENFPKKKKSSNGFQNFKRGERGKEGKEREREGEPMMEEEGAST